MKSIEKLLILMLISLSYNLISQSTFIKRYNILESDNSIFKGVIATDSAYWVMSNESDTFPPYYIGTGFYKINLSGEIELKNILESKTKFYGNSNNFLAKTNKLYTLALEPYDSNRLVVYDIIQDTALEILATGNKLQNGNFLSINVFNISNDEEFLIANTVSSMSDDFGQIQLEKFDSNLKLIFTKIFGKFGITDVPYSLKTDDQGTIYVGCVRFKRNYSVLDNNYSRSVIYKLTSNGVILEETIADSLSSNIYDFIVDSDKNYLCATEILLPGNNVVPFAYPAIMKVSPDGHIVWRKYFEEIKKESLHQIFSKIRETKNKTGYVALGGILVTDDDINPGYADTRAMFVKFDNDGGIIWKRIYKTAIGVESTDMYDMDLTIDGGYVFTGLGAVGDSNGLSWKTILIKVDSFGCLIPGCQLTDNTNPDFVGLDFKIFPNPATEYLAIYNPTNDKLNFKIIDLNGRELTKFKTIPNETSVVDLSNYPKGLYLIQALNYGIPRWSKIFIKE